MKPGFKVMMIGSKEEQIANIDLDPSEIPNVINDFDIDDEAFDQVAIHNRSEYLAKVERRVKDIKINVMNAPRDGKKLLVLDIDYTLFGNEKFHSLSFIYLLKYYYHYQKIDHRSTAEHASQLMRPYLHEFLTSAYQDYDIVIWCEYFSMFFLS